MAKLITEMKDGYKIYQHRSIEERIVAANLLMKSTDLGKMKILIDTFDNNTNREYAALPERLYILHEGTLAYVGGVGPFFYNLSEVEKWLGSFRSSKSSHELMGNLRIDSRTQ